MDPITILAALGPLAVDLGKTLISRYVAPDQFKPATIDDYAKMKQIDIDLFKAMNDAGGNNPSYPWVEAVVRLMRPSIAFVVITTWAALKLQNITNDSVDNFAASVGFYLFADRTLFYSRKGKS